MAEDHGYDTSVAGKMDYAEHQRTYERFLAAFKYGTIWIIAILLGMLVSLIGSAGFFAGIATFLVFGVVATFLAK